MSLDKLFMLLKKLISCLVRSR